MKSRKFLGHNHSSSFRFLGIDAFLENYVSIIESMEQWCRNDEYRGYDVELIFGNNEYVMVINTYISYEV